MEIAPNSSQVIAPEESIMAKPLLPDELWEIIKPVLPQWTPSPKGGQPRLDDRSVLRGYPES
jgi:hypothetical protein